MVTRMAIQMLKGSVEKVAGFSIRDLNPIDYVDRCMLPTLFMCAQAAAEELSDGADVLCLKGSSGVLNEVCEAKSVGDWVGS